MVDKCVKVECKKRWNGRKWHQRRQKERDNEVSKHERNESEDQYKKMGNKLGYIEGNIIRNGMSGETSR